MTFVCLWIPRWPTGAGPAADPAAPLPASESTATLAAALLTVAPRVTVGRQVAGGLLLWVDANYELRTANCELRTANCEPRTENCEVRTANCELRTNNPPRAVSSQFAVRSLVRSSQFAVLSPQFRAGIAATPIAAELAARWSGDDVREVAPGDDRRFVGMHPIAVLEPPQALRTLLDGIGVETCGDLAALDRASVEVRLGADGLRLWRLARADDPRLIFGSIPRLLPHASLDWVDYPLTHPERLLFVVNALVDRVCLELAERGEGARQLVLAFSLANRRTVEHPVLLRRATASRTAWMRQIRLALDALTLPDAVVGIAVRAEIVAPLGGRQGDLFDRGFGSARAAEEALARLVDDGATVVMPESCAHPLPERRTRWIERDPQRAANFARPGGALPLPRLALYLLAEPRTIVVDAAARRDHRLPERYRDDHGWHDVVAAAGPERVSGGQWDAPYAREYFRCVTTTGALVWLFRDAAANVWYLHGWWD